VTTLGKARSRATPGPVILGGAITCCGRAASFWTCSVIPSSALFMLSASLFTFEICVCWKYIAMINTATAHTRSMLLSNGIM
jgi:hypothetical protein